MNHKEFFKNNILIYSNYCKYSENFIKTLLKNQELYNTFKMICIDVNTETKKRPNIFYEIQNILQIKITKVPTIITCNAENVLTDSNAFKWLNFEINKLNENKELVGFNPNEMANFSDKYSKILSTDIYDANEQNYKFYVNKQLSDDNLLNTNISWNNDSKTNGFLNELESSSETIDYETFKNNRDLKIPSQNTHQINFTEMFSNSNENFLNKNGSMKPNKSAELDKKLQQLQLDREKTDNLLQQSPRNVRF